MASFTYHGSECLLPFLLTKANKVALTGSGIFPNMVASYILAVL